MSSNPNLHWDKVPRLWPGERVYIVGGGPSLKGFDWERLHGLNVLALNAAAWAMPQDYRVRVVMFVDRPFYKLFRSRVKQFVMSGGGLVLDVTNRPRPADYEGIWWDHWALRIKRLEGIRNQGISTDPAQVCYNRGCGGAALNVAYLLGAKEIVLLGYDGSTKAGLNWHDEYEDGRRRTALITPLNSYWLAVDKAMRACAEQLEQLGVKVYNTNMNSAHGCFPKVPLEDLID